MAHLNRNQSSNSELGSSLKKEFRQLNSGKVSVSINQKCSTCSFVLELDAFHEL